MGNHTVKNCHNPESWDFNLGDPYDDIYFNEKNQKKK